MSKSGMNYLVTSPINIYLDQKDKVNFENSAVIIWETNNCNTHIAKYLKK